MHFTRSNSCWDRSTLNVNQIRCRVVWYYISVTKTKCSDFVYSGRNSMERDQNNLGYRSLFPLKFRKALNNDSMIKSCFLGGLQVQVMSTNLLPLLLLTWEAMKSSTCEGGVWQCHSGYDVYEMASKEDTTCERGLTEERE